MRVNSKSCQVENRISEVSAVSEEVYKFFRESFELGLRKNPPAESSYYKTRFARRGKNETMPGTAT